MKFQVTRTKNLLRGCTAPVASWYLLPATCYFPS